MLKALHNIPMRAKFFAASVVLLLSLIGLGAIAYVTLDKSAQGLYRLSNSELNQQQVVSDLTYDVFTAHVKVTRLVNWASSGVSDHLLRALGAEMNIDLASIDKRIHLFAQRAGFQPTEQISATIIAAKWEKYSDAAKDTLEVAQVDAAMATMMLGAADDDFQSVASELQSIFVLVAKETQATSRGLAKGVDEKRYILVVGGMIAVLLSVLITLFVGGSVVGPIQYVTKAMMEVSSGNLSLAVGYARRKDEIGQMVEAINAFRNNIGQQNRALEHHKEELRLQNLRFDTALRHMSQGLCMFDSQKRLVVWNDRFAELYRLPRSLLQVGTPHDAIMTHRVLDGVLTGATTDAVAEKKLAALGELLTDAASSRVDALADGRRISVARQPMAEGGWVATHEDVTERQSLNLQLAQNNALLSQRTSLLQAIIDNFPGGIGFFDHDLRLLVCNERAKALLDLPERLFANGPPYLEDLLRFNAGRGEFGPGDIDEQVSTRLALARNRKGYAFERERPDGTVLDVRGVPLDNGGFVATYMDVTERRRSEDKIAYMARHDALTGLPNRTLFRDRLDKAVTGAREGDRSVAVHMLDLDRFKEINDTLGHPIGDALLKAAAQRLRRCVRETDTLARLGGDEFAIVQRVTDPVTDGAALAQRIQEAMSASFDLGDHHVTIGTSVGIAIAPADGSDPDQLLKNADLALYRAKGEVRGSHRFFEPEMDQRMQTRRSLERDLRSALLNNEFELYYQPLVNLERDEVCGFEALLRWNHPQRGRVSPGEFIPLAEETGLIVPIGEWVLRQACSEAAGWSRDVKLAVNLSPAQFKSHNLVQSIVIALANAEMAPQRLELEITESVMLQDVEAVLETFKQLRDLGVRIALDDFGTGYSSLSNLRKFPFDKIKIDRSFISDLTGGSDDAVAVVRSLAQLGLGLGIVTTAEGVETQEQLDRVRAEGYTEMQGFYICAPSPAHEIERLLSVRSVKSQNAA